MSKKIRKHFLYGWVREDLFGEYTLKKTVKNKLVKKILLKIKTNFFDPVKSKPSFGIKQISRKKFDFFIRRLRFFTTRKRAPSNLISVFSKMQKIKRRSATANKFSIISKQKNIRLKLFFKKTYFNFRNFFKIRAKFMLLYHMIWGKIPRVIYGRAQKYAFSKNKNPFLQPNKFSKIPKSLHIKIYDKNVYVAKKSYVKKHEVKFLKKVHILRFLRTEIPATHKALKKKLAKIPEKTSMGEFAICELSLTNSVIRSGLLENGYFVSNLARRGAFLINSFSSITAYAVLKPWDILTMSPKIWWFVYARINLFLKQKKLAAENTKIYRKKTVKKIIARKNRQKFLFVKRHKKLKNLLKFLYRFNKNKIKNKNLFLPNQENGNNTIHHATSRKPKIIFNKFKKYLCVSTHNSAFPRILTKKAIKLKTNKSPYVSFSRKIIFLPAPSHMEISYRLFSILLCGVPRVGDVTLPTSYKFLRKSYKNLRSWYPKTFKIS